MIGMSQRTYRYVRRTMAAWVAAMSVGTAAAPPSFGAIPTVDAGTPDPGPGSRRSA
jgi:hypothetical protein